MEFIKSLVTEDSKELYLNKSQSRSLQVCLDSVHPEPKLVIRLLATHDDREFHVDFTLDSWESMLSVQEDICSNADSGIEEIAFISNQLKVFTQLRNENIAVCFMDFSSRRVNMKLKTFKKMIEISKEVTSMYSEYEKKIKLKANLLKSFAESIIQKNYDQKKSLSLFKILDKLQNWSSEKNIKSVPASRNRNDMATDDHDDDDDEDESEAESEENNKIINMITDSENESQVSSANDESETDSETSEESENNCNCYHCSNYY